jgi:hypothetical protein
VTAPRVFFGSEGRAGLAWASRLRGFMAQIAGHKSAVQVAGTFGWVLSGAVAGISGLVVFAVVGSVRATPTFPPLSVEVPVAAMLLVGLTSLTFAGVGALVAAREPGNAVGWLFLSIGGCIAVTLACIEYVALGFPAAQWAEWGSDWISTGPLILMPFVLLLFPDGKLLSRRWSLAAWLSAAAGVGVLYDAMFDWSFGWSLLPVAILVGVASFVARFRSSTGDRREQLKWLALASSLVAAAYLLLFVAWTLSEGSDTDFTGLSLVVLTLSLMMIPVASGVAIMRYRLYDIDLIINRTLVYGVLTAFLTLFYLGLVIVLQRITASVTADSDLAVAVSTLAVAALFRPLRSRVQGSIDRRFYRRKYNAATTLEQFSQRLTHELNLEAATRELMDVINYTMGPSQVSVWLLPYRSRRDRPGVTRRGPDLLGGRVTRRSDLTARGSL